MIICPACSEVNKDLHNACKNCNFLPPEIDGFISWAPELAKTGSGFKSHHFGELAKAEENYFWFRSRNKLIQWALKKYFPQSQSLLEVGCGTGFVLSGLARTFPQIKLTGSEIFTAGLKFAGQRLPNAELVQADARHLPYFEEFDVVAAFDVIEHIKEDRQAIACIHKAIKPGGGCLITVPQHQWLWSHVDVEACHERRYSSLEIHEKIKEAGFEVLFSTSFVTFLLPLMILSRVKSKNYDRKVNGNGLQINPLINSILEYVLDAERYLIKCGIRFPIGGSRLIIARKL